MSPPLLLVCSARRGAGRQVEHDAVKRNSIFFFTPPCHLRTDASLAPANSPLSRHVLTRKSPLPCFVSPNDACSTLYPELFLFFNFVELRREGPTIARAFSRTSTPSRPSVNPSVPVILRTSSWSFPSQALYFSVDRPRWVGGRIWGRYAPAAAALCASACRRGYCICLRG